MLFTKKEKENVEKYRSETFRVDNSEYVFTGGLMGSMPPMILKK